MKIEGMKFRNRKLEWSVAVRAFAAGLVFAIVMSLCGFNLNYNSIRENVLRLHILANSDSSEDQALKLKVRDAVLEASPEIFEGALSEAEAANAAREKIDLIKRTAENVILTEGYYYPVTVEIGQTYFDKRVYDDFTLPAGNYEAVRILIGNGQGKNWWCVMFPSVCVPAASKREDVSSVLTNKQNDMVKNPTKYKARFKVVEVFDYLQNKIAKISKKF